MEHDPELFAESAYLTTKRDEDVAIKLFLLGLLTGIIIFICCFRWMKCHHSQNQPSRPTLPPPQRARCAQTADSPMGPESQLSGMAMVCRHYLNNDLPTNLSKQKVVPAEENKLNNTPMGVTSQNIPAGHLPSTDSAMEDINLDSEEENDIYQNVSYSAKNPKSAYTPAVCPRIGSSKPKKSPPRSHSQSPSVGSAPSLIMDHNLPSRLRPLPHSAIDLSLITPYTSEQLNNFYQMPVGASGLIYHRHYNLAVQDLSVSVTDSPVSGCVSTSEEPLESGVAYVCPPYYSQVRFHQSVASIDDPNMPGSSDHTSDELEFPKI